MHLLFLQSLFLKLYFLYTQYPQDSKTSPRFQSHLQPCLHILRNLQQPDLLYSNIFTFSKLPLIPEHFLYTCFMHFLHWMEFTPTPFPQIAHIYLEANFCVALSAVQNTFVLLRFTFNPFFSKAFFYL